MTWLWIGPSVVLLFLYGREWLRNRRLSRSVTYMTGKLDEIAKRGDGSGERLRLIASDKELRELLRAVNELQERARRSQSDYRKTEQAMRKMLANVSHDLKTPLTVVMGYAEMLHQQANLTDEERSRLLGKVHEKTLEVLTLMEQFFDLAKLEAEDSVLELKRLEVSELCRRSILAYYELLTSRGFTVDVGIPDEAAYVYGNEEALLRILDNLISNAVRYGADGSYIGLLVKLTGEEVRIEVTDRGRGIQESDLDRVFERLYTLDDSRNRNFQGSGLGLTITKRLAERMKGCIELASEPGVQTTFTVVIPRMKGLLKK
ncbi:HAMP domain-containing histidine kinase [Paenibacillus sp. J5C_2022]|uniref:sensor histidine kinase n=1 Tax=Paenibacillus sp. J5C2022 TaxID=2977129 RepID=UPI0021CE62F9|nr:HAMP domain-containing sensor histidine kinase [Paenibacillus sp. J5C2022]MCU6711727.1 HAMP domain-containing histidine kinase [Paenibacillus sp. J5C2022]